MNPAGWMRRQRDRPIAESERHTAMATVVIVLAATALLLGLTQPQSHTQHATRRIEQARKDTPAASHMTSALALKARQAAERFLAGYLNYTYGHTSADRIEDASRSLTHSLESQPPRVPPAARARHPRVIALYPTVASASNVAVSAVVNDGGLIDYTVELTVARKGGRMVVTGLQGA